MLKTRVIPCLLLKNAGLVKTVKFKNPKYVGDPINAVKIFNDKEVDELIFLDISAAQSGQGPSLKVVSEIASECFMPLAYGGGVRSLADMRTLFTIGVEKVSVNSAAVDNPRFIREASEVFGAQSIIVSIDVKKNFRGCFEVYTQGGTKNSKIDPVDFARTMEEMGAGEILLNSIDRDGTMLGYDIDLIRKITSAVNIPVIACGGAGKIEHFSAAIERGNASAVAAGSLFVFHGRHRAVLITYPSQEELKTVLK